MIVGEEREWRRGEYLISTDNERLDLSVIHDFISNQSYWGQGRKIETVKRSLDHCAETILLGKVIMPRKALAAVYFPSVTTHRPV